MCAFVSSDSDSLDRRACRWTCHNRGGRGVGCRCEGSPEPEVFCSFLASAALSENEERSIGRRPHSLSRRTSSGGDRHAGGSHGAYLEGGEEEVGVKRRGERRAFLLQRSLSSVTRPPNDDNRARKVTLPFKRRAPAIAAPPGPLTRTHTYLITHTLCTAPACPHRARTTPLFPRFIFFQKHERRRRRSPPDGRALAPALSPPCPAFYPHPPRRRPILPGCGRGH